MIHYILAGYFTREIDDSHIVMNYNDSLDGNDVSHFSNKPICGSLCHAQLCHAS